MVRIAGYDAGHGIQLRSQIQRLKLADRIQLTGFQSNMPSFLGSVDIFVMPSLSEGLGQVVIEAMVAGLPIVASDLPALTELITSGETGLLVPPANAVTLAEALEWLLDHPGQAAELGKRAQERARDQFTIARMSSAVKEVYDLVTAQRTS
jgi:glycosyltransferase involved in cell wall biosynthesis